jgi:hypothetical protein
MVVINSEDDWSGGGICSVAEIAKGGRPSATNDCRSGGGRIATNREPSA